MFPFISQCPLYYSDSEKEEKPYCRVRFSVCRNAFDSRGRVCFHKVQFCNKTQFPFHIRATLWQRNCSRCLSQREHNCEACWHPARSVSPALAAGWGAAAGGKALAQLWLDVSTAKEAAIKHAGLCPTSVTVCCPLFRWGGCCWWIRTAPEGSSFLRWWFWFGCHSVIGTGCLSRWWSPHPGGI